jgi:hypothetical protein
MKICQRCGTSANITDHHILPLAHFGTKRTNRHTIPLCEKHHQILENGILFLEARLGGTKFGTRVKLKAQEYETIANLFIKKRFSNGYNSRNYVDD